MTYVNSTEKKQSQYFWREIIFFNNEQENSSAIAIGWYELYQTDLLTHENLKIQCQDSFCSEVFVALKMC